MERFIGTDIESVLNFSTYSPPELRHLSYRRNNFCILCCRSLSPEIETTVALWHSSPPLCHSENAHRTGISWGVRTDGPQLSMLTPWALLCFQVAVALASSRRKIFWTTGAPWQFCATRSGKWLLAQLTMDLDWCYALHIQKLYHISHFTVGGCWNKSLHLQLLQRCYCENLGVPLVHASCDIITLSQGW